MNLVPCRDCGTMHEPTARGCAICARNLDAERMLGKFLLIVFITATVISGLALWLLLRTPR